MKDIEYSDVSAFWICQIEAYEKEFSPWEEKSKKIIKRYKDSESSRKSSRFNILWSNIQTLHPAIYAHPPKPNIERRFVDQDDLGLYSSMTLERAVGFYVDNDTFDRVMKQAILDRLLPGRGQAWVRYVPVIEEVQGSEEEIEEGQITDDAVDAEPTLKSEDVIVDYVHWKDFGHTWARTWEEVRAVWRIVYMSRKELIKRFGEEIGEAIPLDAKTPDGKKDNAKKAVIYEIWDKTKREAIWLSKSYEDVLDTREDPLELQNFFPCPRPVYATLSNDDLIPTPDYVLYQDQAIELDQITGRISSLLKAVKIAGVYDASASGIDRLLSEGVENKLIPVDQWAKFGDKGLQGVISYFPIKEIVETITALQAARQVLKNDIYEITGISDIVRGQTMASETATAQQIKGQFATMRLDYTQSEVARFGRDLVVIMTEIIAKHFSMDTIIKISGLKLLTDMQKQQIQMQMQMAQQMPSPDGQPVQPPELPEEVQEQMELPSWEDVERLIRDDTARAFRIEIETDSTIKTDQDADKQARIEFLGAVGGFLQQAVQAPPDLQPLLGEMLMFGMRGFKVGRDMEATFESAMKEIKRKAEAPQEQGNPELEAEQMRQKGEIERMQMQGQIDQQKGQVEMQQAQVDLQLKQMDLEIKKLELQAKMVDAQSRVTNANAVL
jgi:hypothetical protein